MSVKMSMRINQVILLALSMLSVFSITSKSNGALNCDQGESPAWTIGDNYALDDNDWPAKPEPVEVLGYNLIVGQDENYLYCTDREMNHYDHNCEEDGSAPVTGTVGEESTVSWEHSGTIEGMIKGDWGIVEASLTIGYSLAYCTESTLTTSKTYGHATYDWRFRQFQKYETITPYKINKTTLVRTNSESVDVPKTGHSGPQATYECVADE